MSGLTCLLNDQYFYAGEHSVLSCFHSSQVVLVLLSEFEVHLLEGKQFGRGQKCRGVS